MICGTCGNQTSHIKLKQGRESCPNCGGFKETGGTKVDNILTRNSFRVRTESVKHEEDFIQPHSFSKGESKVKINDDFVKKYPDQAGEYFSDQELTKAGYNKLPEKLKKNKEKVAKEKQGVEFHGDTKKGIERILND